VAVTAYKIVRTHPYTIVLSELFARAIFR
jgi:hypothetical protein